MTQQDNSPLADMAGLHNADADHSTSSGWRRMTSLDKSTWLATDHSIVLVSTLNGDDHHNAEVRLILCAKKLHDALIALMNANRPGLIPVGSPGSAARLNWESRWQAWDDAQKVLIEAGGPVL